MRRPSFGHGRLVAAAGAVLCLLCPGPADARGLTPEDVLRRAGFGQVLIAPGDRWLIVERLGPYASAARFDYDRYTDILRTTLAVADLTRPGPLRPLFPPEPGVGYQAGPIAPDGARLAVFRLKAQVWELGLVTLATGEVRWLGVTPDVGDRGRAVQWADARRLLVLALPPGGEPQAFRVVRSQLGAADRHAAQARGEATVTVLGSGRYLGVDRRDPPLRLLAVDAATGAAVPVATGPFEDLEVSPSGRWAALLEAGEDIGVAADGPVQGARGTEVRRRRLRLVELASGRTVRPCPRCDMLGQLLSWSPRHDQLLAFARADGQAWTAGRLLRIDPRGAVTYPGAGQVSPLVLNRPATVRAGWLADDPIVLGRAAASPDGASPDGRGDWYRLGAAGAVALTADLPEPPPRDGLAVDGATLLLAAGRRAWRIDAQGHARAATASGFTAFEAPPYRVMRRFERGVGARSVLLGESQTRGAPRLAMVGAQGATLTVALPRTGDVRAVAAGGRGAVLRRYAGGGREQLEWIAPDGACTSLATVNDGLAAVEPPTIRAVRHIGARGEPLTSWLVLPSPPAAGGPPPLVVLPYPGSSFARAPRLDDVQPGTDLERALLVAGHGYAALLPSLPVYPDNEGPGVGLAARLLAIVDAAARQADLRQAFDPDRLGLWGFSFGGYGTLAILTGTDRFRVAIAQSSITDLFSKHGDMAALSVVWPEGGLTSAWSAGWTEDLQGDMRGPPWANPQRYLRNSPTVNAHRIVTPVMLVHGDLDTIPVGQSEEMFTALFRQAKDAVFVAYVGEGHLLTSPGNIRDYYRRGFAWLDRYLQPPTAAPAGPPGGRGPAPASGAPRTPPGPPG